MLNNHSVSAVWPSNQRRSGLEVGFSIGATEDRSEDRNEGRGAFEEDANVDDGGADADL